MIHGGELYHEVGIKYIMCVQYHRLSLFWLSEVRPPQYTRHLVWHGLLAIVVYTTTLVLKCIPASSGCP